MNKTLSKIIDLLEEARTKYGIEKDKLDNNGQVTYANGNDGTRFDWGVNDCLCEFGYGVKDGSVWAFKLKIHRDGYASVYCYPHGEMHPVETITKRLATKTEMKTLYQYMLNHADKEGLYDCTLEKLNIK